MHMIDVDFFYLVQIDEANVRYKTRINLSCDAR